MSGAAAATGQRVSAPSSEVVQIDPITNGGITVSWRPLELANAAGLPTYLEKHAFALDAYLEEPQVVYGPLALCAKTSRPDRRTESLLVVLDQAPKLACRPSGVETAPARRA